MTSEKANRWKILDGLLQTGSWTTAELVKKVNYELGDCQMGNVTLRVIQKDLKEMKEKGAPIKMDGRHRTYTKDYSFFSDEISQKERKLICEVLKTLGQFKGLESFEWIQNYLIGLRDDDSAPILSFSSASYLEGTNLLPRLFDVISNKQVIEVAYKPFDRKLVKHVIHPYLLKEYNGRWFLIGAIDADDFIVNFAIDRIKDFRIMDKIVYRPYPKGNINDRYNDLVGITMRQDARMEHVIIWADDLTYNYIRTKHLCRLQYDITGREEENLRASHRNLSDGHFVDLYTLVSLTDGSAEDRSRNYELVRTLTSYGAGLVVLSPYYLQKQIQSRVYALGEMYQKIRTCDTYCDNRQ